ncbi:MAG: DUF559 domain-containing protein [Euzebyales bacterium]|nr:DUF559 domain-containing protein [Euzebyales bacterium]
MPRRVDLTKLRAAAAAQHATFTCRQAAQHGVTHRVLERLTALGEIERQHRGVHRFTAIPLTRSAEIAAAVLAGGPDAVASHDTSLELHGLRKAWPGAPIEICSPTTWHPEVTGIHVHRTRRLESRDITTVDGIRATNGARTLVDLASRYERVALTRLVDDAICWGVAKRNAVYRRSCALRNGRRGVGLLVTLTDPDAEAVFRSWLERLAWSVFDRHGVAQPLWNVPRHDAEGLIGIVDCLWPDLPLVVELEGLRFHTSPQQRRDDARRFNRLGAGARVLRFTWQDVVEMPERMCGQILAALNG